MRSATKAEALCKSYRRRRRGVGPAGSLRSFFSWAGEEVPAVKAISFEVERGEAVGVIGENGAGKSTTLKLLMGVLVPTSVTVTSLGLGPYKERRRLAMNIEGLVSRARGDRGRGRDLETQLHELLCDIRREHPSVSVKVILRTLRADGRMGSEVTACTVRRMLAERGLTRTAAVDSDGTKTRLRWQTERPGALWHGDVCHGPTLTLDGKRAPVRVHGLLDDASRYGNEL